jgi:ADP-heptose:LPS heptosyltransferase
MAMKKRHPHKTNILLVNITRLGDMLQSTPTIAGMKAENPGAKVTVVVEKQFEDVCHWIPNIDEVISLDLGMTVRSLTREGDGIIDAYQYVDEMVEKLRGKKFDYCLNMSSSGYTALLLQMLNIGRNGGWSADEEGYRIIESDWARLFATSVFHQNRQFNSLNLVDVFRASADVEEHPNRLLMTVDSASDAHAATLIREAGFTNTGPLIALQAGASQEKRQWLPRRFVEFAKVLVEKHNCRLALIGTKKELSIIEPIKAQVNSPNVAIFAGKTTIPQLAGVLKASDLLVTGDTGPMHMAVAVGTPVVSMFLASAYGYETGPYSEGNLILQPVITCGPCNPNKPCARPDCHDHIDPTALAELAMMRVRGDVRHVPHGLVDPRKVMLYRTYFDQHGFYDLQALSPTTYDRWTPFREAYRKLWLDDLGGFRVSAGDPESVPSLKRRVVDSGLEGLDQVVGLARQGSVLLRELVRLVRDSTSAPKALGEANSRLTELDRKIEQLGFHFQPLGPLTRMFVFSKENLQGSDALQLASQMESVYSDLARRGDKLARFYANVC